MQRCFLLILATAAASLLIHATAFAQQDQDLGLYCTSGLQPDGYVDFSDLPQAPKFSSPQFGPAVSVPVSAKLPVHGVAGLSVTVTIPALTSAGESVYAYSVDGGTLYLNGLPPYGSPSTVLTLTFSRAIYGLGLNTESYGRFDYNYTLQVGVPGASDAFATTANGYTLSLYSPQTQSLQIVGLQTPFQTGTVQFQGDSGEYYDIELSNLRVRSSSSPAALIPRKGLEQWLRADTGSNGEGIWQDQSGHGHDATPVNYGPYLNVDGRNCQAAWRFIDTQLTNGQPAQGYFTFDLPIAGWDQMTVFLVAKAAKDRPQGASDGGNAAILWKQDTPGGSTFLTPSQTHAFARFGTTQAGDILSYPRPGGGVGQDFTVTRAVHDNESDSLYVNGVLALCQHGKFSALRGASGRAAIGEGINHTFFDGEISEILVYNRVLTDNEAAQVEQYLRRKYGTE